MHWIERWTHGLMSSEPLSLAPFVPLLALALVLVELCLRAGKAPAFPSGAATGTGGTERQVSIDGLRGFLALGVLAHHYAHTYHLQLHGSWRVPAERFDSAYSLVGPAAVAVFFMITGFLFWQRVLVQRGRLDWRRLAISRVYRIMPLYLIVVGLVLLAVGIRTGWQLNEPLHRLLAHIGAWLLFLPPDINQMPRTQQVISGVSWTLRYEWVFYLSLPLWAWLLRRPRWGAPLLGGVALLVVALAAWPVSVLGFKTQYFVYFLVGALAAVAHRSERLRGLAASRLGSHVAVVAVVALFARHALAHGWEALALMTLVFVPIALGNDLYGLLRHRAAVRLGDLSYGIYLLHGPVMFYLFTLALPDLLASNRTPGFFWGGLAATVLLVLGASQLAFRFVETPFIEAGRRLQARLDAAGNAPRRFGHMPKGDRRVRSDHDGGPATSGGRL